MLPTLPKRVNSPPVTDPTRTSIVCAEGALHEIVVTPLPPASVTIGFGFAVIVAPPTDPVPPPAVAAVPDMTIVPFTPFGKKPPELTFGAAYTRANTCAGVRTA